MDLSVIIIGGGGHAKVLIDALLLCSVPIIGATVTHPAPGEKQIQGIPIIGDDQEIFRFSPQHVQLINAIGSTETTAKRKEIYLRFKEHGYSFASVIHPTAIVARDVVLGEGVQVMAGAVIQPGCQIGANSIINTKSSIDHDCRIGDHVHIAPGVTLSGGVRVGDGVHVGTGTTVIQNIEIERDSLIGAGSLVLNDIPEGGKAIGVPARMVL